MGYSRLAIYDTGRTTWVPGTQILQLMEHHGTGVLKITQGEVYIFRGSNWVPVLQRGKV